VRPPPTKAIRMSSNSRNLLRRPAKPAQGRGRIQRGVWEQLVGHNGLATTAAVIAGLYPGKRLQNGGCYQLVRRRLDEVADRVGRDRGRGQSWVWRLRPGHAPKGCWDGWCGENGDPWPERLSKE